MSTSTRTIAKLVACTFQKITWPDNSFEYCYTNRKSLSCKLGNESFKLSIWRPNQPKTDKAVYRLSFRDMSTEEIELRRNKMGDTCYFAVYDDSSYELITQKQFKALGAASESVLQTQLPA